MTNNTTNKKQKPTKKFTPAPLPKKASQVLALPDFFVPRPLKMTNPCRLVEALAYYVQQEEYPLCTLR